MGIRLTTSQRYSAADCICSGNREQAQNLRSAKMALLFTGILLVVATVIAVFALWLAAILVTASVVCGLLAFGYRLIRGHSLQCAAAWGVVGGLWVVVQILANIS